MAKYVDVMLLKRNIRILELFFELHNMKIFSLDFLKNFISTYMFSDH